jgi:hypothetical protein
MTDTTATAWQTLRRRIDRWRRDRSLVRAMSELVALRGAAPSRALLSRLLHGCGNEGWAATLDLLEELAARAPGARRGILECGSGTSTLLLGALTVERRLPIVSLEHHPVWHETMCRRLAAFGLDHVDLRLAPLRRYPDFDWYDASAIPEDSVFDLVLCDGPPGDTRGGRSGLVPSVASRFTPDCVLIVDDTHRAEDVAVVDRWLSRLPPLRRTSRGQHTVLEFASRDQSAASAARDGAK